MSADEPVGLTRCPSSRSRRRRSPWDIDSWQSLRSASIAIRVAVSRRLVLPGTLPRIALTRERNQVFVATAIASAAQAGAPDISAQRLLSAWKGEDPNMRMVAEVIASAFASGLSWKGSLGGKEVYCPPPGFKGGQVMTTLDEFLASNPDLAEKSYGDAMAMSLTRAFPCQRQ
jgi:hypothetical protein